MNGRQAKKKRKKLEQEQFNKELIHALEAFKIAISDLFGIETHDTDTW